MEEKSKKPRYKSFQIHDTIYKTNLTKKFAERKPYKPDDPMKLYSFIPGTILKIMVKEGETIERDTPMLILEAMKMENEILAEFDAKVKKIHVKKGEKIPNKHLIIEFE